MRWKQKVQPQGPRAGDNRVRRWFAWWPVCIGDETRWLEWVTVGQVFFDGDGWFRSGWVNRVFMDHLSQADVITILLEEAKRKG